MRLMPLMTSATAALLVTGCSLLPFSFFGSRGGKSEAAEATAVSAPVAATAPAAGQSGEMAQPAAVAVTPLAPAQVPPHAATEQVAPVVVDGPVVATAAPQTAPRTTDSLLPGRFYVNAGAYAKAANADRAVRLLREAGLPVLTRTITTKRGAKLTGVRAGPFSTPEQAQEAAATAKKLRLETKVFQHRP